MSMNYIAEQRYDGYHYVTPTSASASTDSPYFKRRNKAKPHEETKEQEPIITSTPSSISTPSRTQPTSQELTMARVTQLCRDRDDMYTTPELNDVLMLNDMQIGAIKNLESFPHLITLFLNNNNITHIAGLSHMTSLHSLFLQHNTVTSMVGLESLTSLVTLNLSHNMIESIDIDMSSFTHLQTLDLSNNEIHDIQQITTCSTIRVLNLSHNALSDPTILTTTLASLPHLRCLYLHHNPTLIATTTQYRRICMAHISTLTFLDDRPVTSQDHDAAKAWMDGGNDAERNIRQQQNQHKITREQQQHDAWKQTRQQKIHVMTQPVVEYTHWEEEKQQEPDQEDEEFVKNEEKTPESSSPPETITDDIPLVTDISSPRPIFSEAELALQAQLAASEQSDDLFNVLSQPTLDTIWSDIARTAPQLESGDDSDSEIEIYQVPEHVMNARWTGSGNEPTPPKSPTKKLQEEVEERVAEPSQITPIRADGDITSPSRMPHRHHKEELRIEDKEKSVTISSQQEEQEVDVFADIPSSTSFTASTSTTSQPRNRAWAWLEREMHDETTSAPVSSSSSHPTTPAECYIVDMDAIESRMREHIQQQLTVSDRKTSVDEEDVENEAFWEQLKQIQANDSTS